MQDELQQLVQFIQDDITFHERSRALRLPPAERARRIHQRQAWIVLVQQLAAAAAAENCADNDGKNVAQPDADR